MRLTLAAQLDPAPHPSVAVLGRFSQSSFLLELMWFRLVTARKYQVFVDLEDPLPRRYWIIFNKLLQSNTAQVLHCVRLRHPSPLDHHHGWDTELRPRKFVPSERRPCRRPPPPPPCLEDTTQVWPAGWFPAGLPLQIGRDGC